jgi:flagellar motor protein MotB
MFFARPPETRAQSPAGTIVRNTVRASFRTGAGVDSSASITTATRVGAVFGFRLSPPGTTGAPAFNLIGAPRDTVYCRVTLTNLANTPDVASMSWANVAPATTAIISVVYFLDANANGRFDTGEDNPAFLSLAMGSSTPVDVALVLPAASGTAYVALRATSANDPNLVTKHGPLRAPAFDETVVRVTVGGPTSLLYFGPRGNPRATPGGEGSPNDETAVSIGLYDESVALSGELENAGVTDSVSVAFAGALSLPAGSVIACVDSSGAQYPSLGRGRFKIGTLAAGTKLPIRMVVATPGTPVRFSLAPSGPLRCVAHSLSDSLITNATSFRLVAPATPDSRAMIGIDQTFRQATAAVGDVASMVVTVTNLTDSVRVDNTRVLESPPPSLDFSSGDGVTYDGHSMVWNAGTLKPHEKRSTTLRFVVNSRESKGWARVSGSVTGNAETGDNVTAGPAVAAIRVDNEEIGIEGVILGDVFVDENENGKRDENEHGVTNASVYLESGEHAVTDSLGLFSIPHVFQGYRMVRLDASTLPPGLELVTPPAAPGSGPRSDERLVHLLAPGMARVSFPVRTAPIPMIDRAVHVTGNEVVTLTQLPRRYQSVVLPSSYFALGRAVLRKGTEGELSPVADFLNQNPGWSVLIEGHTDSQPIHSKHFPSNVELSQARAEAVRDAIVSHGINPERFLVMGYGDARPVASNETAEGRKLNRRVEIAFIPPGHDLAVPAERIAAAVHDLSAQPDSMRTSVTWALATNSSERRSGALRIDVPAALHDAWVDVTMNGRQLAEEGGAYVFDGYTRGASVECRLMATVASTDTSAIRGITATLALRDSTDTPPSASNLVDASQTAVIHPVPGASAVTPRSFDVASWTEHVQAPRVNEVVPTPAAETNVNAAAKALAIIEPRDGFVSPDRDQVRVRAKHPLGVHPVLSVNGETIDDQLIGQRTIDVTKHEETTTWYGVHLREGWNRVIVRTATGTPVLVDSVRVALSSRPAEIVPLNARALVPADGRKSTTLHFAVRDGFGLPVMDGFVVTVSEGDAWVDVPDARPAERGLQVLTHEGLISLPIKPRHDTARGTITVEGDGMRASTEVVFVTPNRPLLATGIVDINAGVFSTDGKGSGHGIENYRDGFDVTAESRLFVQGAAPGGVNVTARLDTKKQYDDPLFKQPDPDKQYPVFGDASQMFYSAPARGGNYVSLDKGQSYLRYGDMRTPIDNGEFLTYQQAVTGLSSSLTDGANSVRAFVTKTDFVTRTDEIPANGTSGFYHLSHAPIVENSERVIIETRDRYQSEKVLEARVMIRRRDYSINPYDGSILFFEPVPVTDRDLNPNHIVVMYDQETGDASTYLFGARADVVQGSRYRAGVTAVANSGDAPGYALFGGNGEVRWKGIKLGGELARSTDDVAGDGGAYKIDAAATRGASKLDMYYRHVDGDFSNPSFRGADSELASNKAGFDGRWMLSPSLALNADGYTHELQRTDETRATARATLDYRRRLLEMSAGLRVAEHDQPTGDANGTLGLAGLTLGNRGSAGISTTWEQNLGNQIVDDYPNRLKTELAVPLSQHFRAIVTHEYLTSALSSTQQIAAGIEGNMGGTQAYSRYAMDRVGNDDRMGAVSGIRQRLQLSPTLSATGGVEGFLSISGRDADEYVSLTTGLSSRVPGKHFIDGGYEYRWERLAQRHLARISTAQQLDGGFAWLVSQDQPGQHDGTQFYSTLALAWRSPFAPVQSLAMVKSLYDRYAPVDPDAIRWRVVASTDVNYLPSASHELRLKYAYKYVEDYSYGASTTTQTDLVLGQYLWHFGHGWDIDTWGRMVSLRAGDTQQYGYGAELGRVVFKSVRLAAGYSVNGFDDPDISNTDAWSRGFSIRIQMMLSDWLLSDFQPLNK